MTWIIPVYILMIVFLAWEVHNAENYPDNCPTGCLNEWDVEKILERSRRLKR